MTTAMPGNKARARAFWAELFNAHDLRNVRGFFAPGFVNHNARPGTPDGPEGAVSRPGFVGGYDALASGMIIG